MKEAQEQVAQRSQSLGAFTGTTSILSKRHIPLVVQSVLDGPVAPAEARQGSGIGLLWRQTGEVEVGLLGNSTAMFMNLVVMDGHDLLQSGEGCFLLRRQLCGSAGLPDHSTPLRTSW